MPDEGQMASGPGQPALYIVVPLLNEVGNVPRLADSFRSLADALTASFRLQFVAVDDGCTDDTVARLQEAASSLDLTVLSHEKNEGPGRAFGTAFEHLAGQLQEDDWILTIEGDNTSRLELVQQMITRTGEGYDVVLASPYAYGGGITNTSAWRTFMSHMANLLVKEAMGIHGILTMSSFFRLCRGRVILDLQRRHGPRVIDRYGFESMIELLLKMIFIETTISEVAMILDTSLRAGKSKMKVIKTVLGYFSIIKDKRRWQQESKQ